MALTVQLIIVKGQRARIALARALYSDAQVGFRYIHKLTNLILIIH